MTWFIPAPFRVKQPTVRVLQPGTRRVDTPPADGQKRIVCPHCGTVYTAAGERVR